MASDSHRQRSSSLWTLAQNGTNTCPPNFPDDRHPALIPVRQLD